MAEQYIGQQLGNYRLISLLGRGGFADVYLGEHVHLRTQAAIKVMHTQLEHDTIESFLAEARTIAHLSHPHIVRVLDFDVRGSVPFLVMEYAPNGTLRSRHPKGGAVPEATFLPYVKELASALQYAHDRQIIHRDVKPENMLLGRDEGVLLSDFGIALVVQNSLSQSTADTVVGTTAYMAPEQIQGKPRPASDQYSLAVVVYEWLSGRRPFNGSYMEIITQHLSSDPPSLHAQLTTIPYAVEHVVRRALAKDPHQRFARVQDFADSLEEAYRAPLQGGPVPAQSGAYSQYQPQQPPAFSPTAYAALAPAQVLANPQPGPAGDAAPAAWPQGWSSVGTSAKKIRRGVKRGLRVLLITLLLLSLLLCGGGYAAYHYFSAGAQPSAPTHTVAATTVASDFVQSFRQRNYDRAYNDLGPQLTASLSRSAFIQQAMNEDSCFGRVTNTISTGTSTQGSTLHYTYQMTRANLSQPYQLYVDLQQNSSGAWQISDYNSDLSQNTTC